MLLGRIFKTRAETCATHRSKLSQSVQRIVKEARREMGSQRKWKANQVEPYLVILLSYQIIKKKQYHDLGNDKGQLKQRDKFRGHCNNLSKKWLWLGVWCQCREVIRRTKMAKTMLLNMQEGIKMHRLIARNMDILSIVRVEKVDYI